MKILVAGDLHFQKEKFESLNRLSIDCDVLCLTGDYLDDRLADREDQIEWVSKWVLSNPKPIVMCSGNHDLDDLAECDWVYNLASKTVKIDNSIWTHRGVNFGAVPYIGARYSQFANCQVIVCHVPPSNTKTSQQDGIEFGDDDLYFSITRGVIRPGYVFCGHVEKPDKAMDRIGDTKIVNASSNFYVIEI